METDIHNITTVKHAIISLVQTELEIQKACKALDEYRQRVRQAKDVIGTLTLYQEKLINKFKDTIYDEKLTTVRVQATKDNKPLEFLLNFKVVSKIDGNFTLELESVTEMNSIPIF